MKVLALLMVLQAAPAVVPERLRVFGRELVLRPDCAVETSEGGVTREVVPLPFEKKDECAIIPKSETNVPHLEFVKDSYVLLVESRETSKGDCKAQYVGVVVSRDGKVKTLRKPMRTGTCGSDQDRAAFEYLYHQANK